MCFWCPLKYTNWEILWCFVWSWSSRWGQLNTWKSWPLALEQGGQCRGRWEFALLSLEFWPICHGITPTIWHILASEGAFFAFNLSLEMFYNYGSLKQLCWIVRVNLGAFTLEVRSFAGFLWFGLTGLTQMTSNWANSYWGSLWWVDTESRISLL